MFQSSPIIEDGCDVKATARELAQKRNYGNTTRAYVGKREDAISNDGLPVLRLSDPRTVYPKHQAGCLLDLEEGLYVCVTHGVTLGWVV